MTTINDLPNELLLHIFSFLGENPNSQVSCVCRRWDQLIVPDLRLRVRLHDDKDHGVRSFLRRSTRQYRALTLQFPESPCDATEIGDRTGLWILGRFLHVTDVKLEFNKYDFKRIVRFLDALGPNLLNLTIFANNVQDDRDFVPGLASRKVVPLANVRYIHFANFNRLPKQFYAWFIRKVPKLAQLKVSICYQAEVIINLYADQLERLEIVQLSYERNYNHLKCPNLTHFSFRMETGGEFTQPIQLDQFFKHAPKLRHLELYSDCPCQDVVSALVHLPNLEVLGLRSDHFVPFDERIKLPALKKLFFGGRIADFPSLPALRLLHVFESTGDLIYTRIVQRAPHLTKLTVDRDGFLNDEVILCICTGLPQLVNLHLTVHRSVEISETAFEAIHLLTQLKRFHICFEDISMQESWLGEWFKRLPAPTVIIEILNFQFLSNVMPPEDFELLLQNERTRVLTLKKIFVRDWHNSIREEVAEQRPDLLFFYLEPMHPMIEQCLDETEDSEDEL